MNKIYFRGHAFDYEEVELLGERLFVLFKDGELYQYVKEDELDIRSRVSLILDAYYKASETVEVVQ